MGAKPWDKMPNLRLDCDKFDDVLILYFLCVRIKLIYLVVVLELIEFCEGTLP
tara:strand:+ start:74 stop:232 length:159 start_codon:yes stop_codon:yes gene_type:complete